LINSFSVNIFFSNLRCNSFCYCTNLIDFKKKTINRFLFNSLLILKNLITTKFKHSKPYNFYTFHIGNCQIISSRKKKNISRSWQKYRPTRQSEHVCHSFLPSIFGILPNHPEHIRLPKE
jgi:hypothetical protein